MGELIINKKIFYWEISGIVFISLLGSLDHFFYEWTGLLPVALFSPVNESVWEHLKLIFWPGILFFSIEYKFLKIINNFAIAKAICVSIPPILFPLLYYSCTPFIGTNVLAFDIMIFIISIVIGQLLSYKLLISELISKKLNIIGLIILIAWGFIYILFTFIPPRFPFFQCNVTGGYGIG